LMEFSRTASSFGLSKVTAATAMRGVMGVLSAWLTGISPLAMRQCGAKP
jgi:hypothetical protein